MRELIKKLYPYCVRHKWMYVWGLITVLISNFLYVRSNVWVGKAVDFLLGTTSVFATFWPYIAIILGCVIIGSIAQYLQRILLIGTSRVIEYEYRNDFFTHLTRLSPSFYDRMKTGDIISRATGDIDQIRMALGPGIMYPMSTLTVVPITLWAMFASSWTVTLYCCIPMLILPVLVNVLATLIYKRSLRIQEHFSDFSGRIQESITGIRVVKSFVQKQHELATLDAMNEKNARLNVALAKVMAAFHPILVFLFMSGIIIILKVATPYITDNQALLAADARMLTKGQLVAFLVLYRRLFFPVIGLGWVVSLYQRAAASMHRIQLIWSRKPAIQDSESTDKALKTIEGDIEFRNLTFCYPETSDPALSDVSFSIKKGTTLGIVGAVGSGKSTIAHLLSRLYDPPDGTVFVDGRDVKMYTLDLLRRSVAMVFQETFLFSDSIKENICFGAGESVDEALAAHTAHIAAIDRDIAAFPKRYDTMLGERGVNLSGGQKQRVAIARALAFNAPILVLDDAFASVDTRTEEEIIGNFRSMHGEQTMILISHRISTVQLADEIIVLDQGRIVERGSHDALVAAGGPYADIHYRQMLEKAIEEENSAS